MATTPTIGPNGNITGVSNVTYVQAAYDRMAYFSLRPELIFDQLADVKSVNQSMPGSSVTFTIQNDLLPAVTPLSQSTDITTQTLSNSQIVVSLAEYGSAVTTNAVLRGESYVEIDPIVANVIGYNAGVSIDSVARNALSYGGTQFKNVGTATLSTRWLPTSPTLLPCPLVPRQPTTTSSVHKRPFVRRASLRSARTTLR